MNAWMRGTKIAQDRRQHGHRERFPSSSSSTVPPASRDSRTRSLTEAIGGLVDGKLRSRSIASPTGSAHNPPVAVRRG